MSSEITFFGVTFFVFQIITRSSQGNPVCKRAMVFIEPILFLFILAKLHSLRHNTTYVWVAEASNQVLVFGILLEEVLQHKPVEIARKHARSSVTIRVAWQSDLILETRSTYFNETLWDFAKTMSSAQEECSSFQWFLIPLPFFAEQAILKSNLSRTNVSSTKNST